MAAHKNLFAKFFFDDTEHLRLPHNKIRQTIFVKIDKKINIIS